MEQWFQIVLTIFSSVLASSGLWAYLTKRSERKDVKTEMLIGLAHDRIMYLLYEPYEKLGGNGSAKRIMRAVDQLPIHKFAIDKEEKNDEHE